MKILAIETSCDDTGVAVLEVLKTKKFKILSNVIASQIEVHQKYGGVYPMMAKREHQKNLVPCFVKSLKESNLLEKSTTPPDISKLNEIKIILEREPELYKALFSFFKKYTLRQAQGKQKPDIDLISVTNGPGLEPCLWVGVNFAKAISYFWNIPVVPVNHIEGHILVNLFETKIIFPAIALIVSGGHTQIILVKKISDYKILGETRDDAAGECFDKCAKILGLGYPGGPIISKLAEGIKPTNTLPRPMHNTKDYDFSFSGLKTAVLYADRKVNPSTRLRASYKRSMATEVQQAIIDVLIKKTVKAVKDFKVKSLILGGGVSANKELKKQFELEIKNKDLSVHLIYPEPKLSTDNGLMIAITGFYNKKKTTKWQKIKADGNLRI